MNIKYIKLSFLMIVMVMVVGCTGLSKTSSSETIPKTPAENNRDIDETTINLYQFDTKTYTGEKAIIETSMGTIEIVFYPQETPKAVENFLSLAKSGYYTGLRFNKIVENYMVQCGDPEDGTGGRSIWDKPFENEPSLNLWNFRGAVGMASTTKDNNASQFYIITANTVSDEMVKSMEEAVFPSKVINKYEEVGGAPWLDSKHTVFGQVVEGMDVIDKIAALKTDSSNSPLEDVIIQSIKFE